MPRHPRRDGLGFEYRSNKVYFRILPFIRLKIALWRALRYNGRTTPSGSERRWSMRILPALRSGLARIGNIEYSKSVS